VDTEQQAAAPPAPAPAPPEEPVEQVRGYHVMQKPRLILVDDDPNVMTMMTIALRDDYEIVKAMDGLQAVEKIVRCQPDLAVVDIMMPKMSGYQLCESLRRNATFRDMPIIVISAKSSRKDQEYAYRCGANSFLAKPFEPGRLMKLIDSFTHAEGFTIRKKQLSFEQISEEEKEDRERQKRRESEYTRKFQRTELKRYIDEEMKESDDKKK
jgi:DNA-binding response OmpR family regulator